MCTACSPGRGSARTISIAWPDGWPLFSLRSGTMATSRSAAAVARETMARVDGEIGKLERLAATEVAAVNRSVIEREVAAASDA